MTLYGSVLTRGKNQDHALKQNMLYLLFLNILLFKNDTAKEFSFLICLCREVATVVSPEFLVQVCDNLNVEKCL